MSAHDSELRRRDALTRAIAGRAETIATPTLVIDLDAVEHNAAAMVRRVGDPGRWRPHVKTVKQSTIVGVLLDAGVFRFKAATPAEVTLVLEAAATRALPRPVEVLLAYPAAPPQLAAMLRLRREHPEATLGLLADDPEHLRALVEGIARPAELPAFDLWLDVDVGMHRTGSPAARWREAVLARCQWLRPMGLHGYDGHLRWSERAAAHAGYDELVALARALPFAVEQIVSSGTHSYAHALEHAGLCEGPWVHQVSPGTLVLSDRRSAEAARDLGLRQAAFVLSRVVARPGDDRITLDAGSKALAPDCPAPGCAVLGVPELEPLTASEEHRPMRVKAGPRPARGELMWLVPDHVCTTVNLHAEALYLRGGEIVGSAPVRARGHRPWLEALLLALAGLGDAGCQPIVTNLEVELLLPPDATDLQRTNNVSVVLDPQGFSETIATDGLDFALSFERAPDVVSRTLAVYLAEDSTLLAWGRTPPFTYGGATGGLTLMVARPGVLGPLDLDFAEADALARVAPVAELGVLVLASDGSTLFLDGYRYTLAAAASLPDPPALDDATLVGAPDGGVLWVSWGEAPAAWRFDPGEDQWQALELGGDRAPRPGAAAWVDDEEGTLQLLGGGERTDVVELTLVGDEARELVAIEGLQLDGPRAGATAARLGPHLVVLGGDDPTLPALWRADALDGAGPSGAWTSIACGIRGESPPRLLCTGGLRDGMPTADALAIELRTDGLDVQELPELLPAPLPDPLVFADDTAIYAQGAGRWFRLDITDLEPSEPASAATRAEGGDTARLPGGATLVVGGRDLEGAALSQWTVFAPALLP
ncbi:MAG: alanine racemase [Myxococcales bacterium]|nr:alanine racemase [Myxococcales bacterium]